MVDLLCWRGEEPMSPNWTRRLRQLCLGLTCFLAATLGCLVWQRRSKPCTVDIYVTRRLPHVRIYLDGRRALPVATRLYELWVHRGPHEFSATHKGFKSCRVQVAIVDSENYFTFDVRHRKIIFKRQ